MGGSSPVPELHCIAIQTPFAVGDVNVYVHTGGSMVTLFDAAVLTYEAWDALCAGLGGIGLRVCDIGRVMLTHHHFDHVGLLRRVISESSAEICGHPDLLEEIQLSYGYNDAHAEYFSGLMAEMGVPGEWIAAYLLRRDQHRHFIDIYTMDRALANGEELDGFRVVHVPGHSPTDTLFVRDQERWAVTGDHILEKINPNPILRRPKPGMRRAQSLVQYQESLRVTRAVDVDVCFPGHGGPIRDHRIVVDGILAQHERRNSRIMECFPEGGRTPFEAASLLYPRMTSEDVFFCLSVGVGQLELLESRGLLVSRQEDGLVRYYLPAHAPAVSEKRDIEYDE